LRHALYADSKLTSEASILSLRTETDRALLALSDSHPTEGWGTPQNEFMVRLPHLEEDRYESVVIDLDELKPYMGKIVSVNGFRIRPSVKVQSSVRFR